MLWGVGDWEDKSWLMEGMGGNSPLEGGGWVGEVDWFEGIESKRWFEERTGRAEAGALEEEGWLEDQGVCWPGVMERD